ncbi:MAG: deoxyguanosinetriphosphate triphosphohydrolase [Rhodospirillaceae bacterium TMED167]|nr:deoxyguanosinetriphosphate triphosphohydrolase [Rhodospirillaceae bacterium]OUW26946.1 MAG: deoxyguanosinetriphosphate triphosphohydrolase [Rhodospirillaceae bacterium TMED167]
MSNTHLSNLRAIEQKTKVMNDRAVYASRPEESRGRLFVEQESKTRTCFQRDRDRIVHSTAFRRLEYKTQVFVNHEGDHYRTRLTHTLEVAQIARSIARSLRLDEDLAETLALAHDLGHTPFGHAGEDALSEMMQGHGGFDHNAQSLAVVTRLEERYPEFDGLNLVWETLEGLVKHNGPLMAGGSDDNLPREIARFSNTCDLELHTFASAEAQVAALADDIAYNNHDIDDGLRAGLFQIEDLFSVPVVGDIFRSARADFPDIDATRLGFEAVRRLIGEMVTDCLTESGRRLNVAAPASASDVRDLDHPVVAFSDAMASIDLQLKEFLFANMYRHQRVNKMTGHAGKVVKGLFSAFLEEPARLPKEWRLKTGTSRSTPIAHVVADYIAGMTDRFALDEHAKLKEQGVLQP